jgi:hypothetical protein
MAYVEHVNVVNDSGNVYCCLRNKVVEFNEEHVSRFCSACMMNRGLTPGKSVQCSWKDHRAKESKRVVLDPSAEFHRMQRRKTYA